jgi:hypothetical protein
MGGTKMKQKNIKLINDEMKEKSKSEPKIEDLKETISYEPQTNHLEEARKFQEADKQKRKSFVPTVSHTRKAANIEVREINRSNNNIKFSYLVTIKFGKATSSVEGTLEMPFSRDVDITTIYQGATMKAMEEFAKVISIREE